MEVVQRGNRRVETNESDRNFNIACQIAAAGARVGLYIATAVLAYRAAIKASEILAARSVIAGGEVFTVPLIIGLVWIGWEIRGDVEHAWRRFCKSERRRQRRGH